MHAMSRSPWILRMGVQSRRDAAIYGGNLPPAGLAKLSDSR